MKLPLRFSLGLLLLALLAACAPGALTADSAGPSAAPALEFSLVPEGSQITEFNPPGTGSRARLNVTMLARNPGGSAVALRNLDWSFVLEGRRVAGGTLIVNDRVPAGGSLPVSLSVTVPLVDQAELLRAIGAAHTGTPAGFLLDGVAGYQLADGSGRSSAFQLQGEALAAQPVTLPELKLLSAMSGAFELQPGVPVVRLSLSVHNPGDIGYFLNGKDLGLSLAGVPLAVQDLQPVPLAGGESRRIDLVFHPENPGQEALRILSDAMAGYQVAVHVSGSLFLDVLGLGTFPMPTGVVVEGVLGN